MARVDQGRILRDSLYFIEYGGQLFVVHLDELQGFAGLPPGGGRDGHDGRAGEMHFIDGQDGLVLDLAAVAIQVADIVARERYDAGRKGRCVDANDACMGVRRAQDARVPHALYLEVLRVADRAGRSGIRHGKAPPGRGALRPRSRAAGSLPTLLNPR